MSLPTLPDSDVDFATGNDAAITPPPSTKRAQGWIAAELPPVQYFNWLFNRIWQWQIFFDRRTIRTMVITAAGPFLVSKDRFLRVHFDSTLGSQSLVLPAISSGTDDGLTYEIKKVDASSNPVTITGTVEGEVNPTLDYQWTGRAVYAFGGSWFWNK
jgi:hypothetical protein